MKARWRGRLFLSDSWAVFPPYKSCLLKERVITLTKYVIQGGHPLFGEVEISGAKNAAVAIIPAALMVDGTCRIENIPQISDVTLCLKILEQLGASIRTINRHTVEINCSVIRSTRTSYELARKIRASYYLIGALLGRFGKAEVAMPGGCNFGVRPIDQHVKGFTTLGAKVVVEAALSTPPQRPAASRAPTSIWTWCLWAPL